MEKELRRRVDRNTGWLITDRLLRIPVSILLSVLMVRYLGPAESGLWNYALAFASVFGILAGLAQEQVIVHRLVTVPDRQGEILGSSFLLKFAGGLVSVPLSLVFCLLWGPSDPLSPVLVTLASVGFLFGSLTVLDCWFQAELLSRVPVFWKNVSFVLFSAVKFALLFFRFPLVFFALANLGELFLGFVLVGRSFIRRGISLRLWKADREITRSILLEGLPLFASSFAIVVYTRIDVVMLGMALGDATVGIYSAAVRLGEAWCFIPSALAASALPVLSALKNESRVNYVAELSRVIRHCVQAGLVLAISVSVFSPSIIKLLYGSEFADSAQILSIYMWAVLFIFVGIGSLPYFTAEALQKYTLYRTLAGMAVNVTLNLLLIPVYGAKGAAVATVITQAVASYGFNAVNKQTRELFRIQTKALCWPIGL